MKSHSRDSLLALHNYHRRSHLLSSNDVFATYTSSLFSLSVSHTSLVFSTSSLTDFKPEARGSHHRLPSSRHRQKRKPPHHITFNFPSQNHNGLFLGGDSLHFQFLRVF